MRNIMCMDSTNKTCVDCDTVFKVSMLSEHLNDEVKEKHMHCPKCGGQNLRDLTDDEQEEMEEWK